MDFEKVLEILVFAGGLVTIALAGGFGMLLLIGRMRVAQAKAKGLAEGPDLMQDVEELRARVEDLERRGLTSGEVESQYARLTELEERLDFAERLLAQREVPLRLPGDGGMS